MTTWRNLTEPERNWCEQALRYYDIAPWAICQRAIDQTRIFMTVPDFKNIRGPRSMIAHIALYQRAAGITLGRDVYIRHTMAFNDELPPDLVVHEVAHVVQFLRDGHAVFLARYLKDYARNLLKGMPDYEAYMNIPYEIEARKVESYVSSANRPTSS